MQNANFEIKKITFDWNQDNENEEKEEKPKLAHN
jgi:hypothetical protein